MKLSLVHRPSAPASASPYRLVDDQGQEIAWANDFLDAQRIRQLSLRSLRAYGYDLLHLARWWHIIRPRPCSRWMNRLCSTMSAINSMKSQNRLPKPSTIGWAHSALCIASIPDVRCPQASPSSSVPIGPDRRLVIGARPKTISKRQVFAGARRLPLVGDLPHS